MLQAEKRLWNDSRYGSVGQWIPHLDLFSSMNITTLSRFIVVVNCIEYNSFTSNFIIFWEYCRSRWRSLLSVDD
jgi:hypothetical protein